MLLGILEVLPKCCSMGYCFGEKDNVLGPISWGSTRFDKFRQALLLQDFSGPFLVNRDFDLLRRGSGVQHFPHGIFQDTWDLLWATQA